jgi:hypothetical protein
MKRIFNLEGTDDEIAKQSTKRLNFHTMGMDTNYRIIQKEYSI